MADHATARGRCRHPVAVEPGMDREELLALPAVVDVAVAARALNFSRTGAYELIRAGQWPTPVFRLGRLIRIPTAPILALLGIEPPDATTGPKPAADSTSRTDRRNAG
ncbi:MAG: hypothetical protein QG608_716 [Actinomycetota bacterium]|nr:hypothetical protein [Actinomycetota bacterium]